MEPYRERIEDFMRRYGRVLAVAVVIVAMAVTSASLLQTPTYEASALVWVEPPPQEMMHAIDSLPVAEETIRRWELEMTPDELLDNLTVEQVEGTEFIRLTYEDTDPMRAKQIANTVGKVSEIISERNSPFNATVWEKAAPPESPVSPHPLRNGLLTLVIGLTLCAGLNLALPGGAARVAGTLGERATRQEVSIVERAKEKKLLLALGRRGKLTAVEAALEASLSVEESRRILEELAFAGHLEVTAEHGKLLYSFWGHGAP